MKRAKVQRKIAQAVEVDRVERQCPFWLRIGGGMFAVSFDCMYRRGHGGLHSHPDSLGDQRWTDKQGYTR